MKKVAPCTLFEQWYPLIEKIFRIIYFLFLDGQPPKYSHGRKKSEKNTIQGLTASGPGLVEDYAEIVDEEGDYSSPAKDYELDRQRIELSEIIGEGQFGDVHKGVFKPSGTNEAVNIAVKTCKVVNDASTAEKFLEEAYIMQQFDHQHIIKLVGICSSSPVNLINFITILSILLFGHFYWPNLVS